MMVPRAHLCLLERRQEPNKSPARAIGAHPCPQQDGDPGTLTSEHVVILIDAVGLETLIQLMQLLGRQHLPLPMGIACRQETH